MANPAPWLAATVLLAFAGCGPDPSVRRSVWDEGADARGHTAATPATVAANAAVAAALPLDDAADFEDARRGFVAADPHVHVQAADGHTVWDTREYAFVEGQAPDSVNPSLWRQALLNRAHGLFRVVEGVHQVRGYDLSNMTLIDGENGWIVVDPLTSVETARAALDLARRHLGERPVSAVILTHSHVDHFGGIGGVLPDDPARHAAVPVVAPADFLEEATRENVIAGIPMARRASFMYGMPLARGARGHVDSGLGVEPARGTVGIARPTVTIDATPQELTLDGVRFVFQHAPHSEAPAELTFYLPDRRAFCGAEIVSQTMHNLYTLRGAKVRDALRWSGAIDEALRLFGGEAEVLFASHHWPVWGNARVVDHLEKQRDTYRYIHDQTLRLASDGHTPAEIAEALELPESLRTTLASRGYYGTVRHNARAVYQAYFGWYDGNPANLDPLPPAEAAVRYVEYMGGAQTVTRRAREAFERGEYRWVAMVMNHVVFADPEDEAARELLARAYDQLGYRAESGPWRDVYLSGAHELRHGVQHQGVSLAAALDLLRHVPIERFLESLATRIDGAEAEGSELVLNFVFTDLDQSFVLWLENAVLHHARRPPDPAADATLRMTHDWFLRLATRQLGLREALFSDEADVDGSRRALLAFFTLVDPPDQDFAVVTP